jgi:hypothetical protein
VWRRLDDFTITSISGIQDCLLSFTRSSCRLYVRHHLLSHPLRSMNPKLHGQHLLCSVPVCLGQPSVYKRGLHYGIKREGRLRRSLLRAMLCSSLLISLSGATLISKIEVIGLQQLDLLVQRLQFTLRVGLLCLLCPRHLGNSIS